MKDTRNLIILFLSIACLVLAFLLFGQKGESKPDMNNDPKDSTDLTSEQCDDACDNNGRWAEVELPLGGRAMPTDSLEYYSRQFSVFDKTKLKFANGVWISKKSIDYLFRHYTRAGGLIGYFAKVKDDSLRIVFAAASDEHTLPNYKNLRRESFINEAFCPSICGDIHSDTTIQH